MRTKIAVLSIGLLILLLSACGSASMLTTNDVQKAFQSEGVEFTLQAPPKNPPQPMMIHNEPPSLMMKIPGQSDIWVYLYPSSKEEQGAATELNEKQAKNLTFGMKNIVLSAKNAMFVSQSFDEKEQKAIEKLR